MVSLCKKHDELVQNDLKNEGVYYVEKKSMSKHTIYAFRLDGVIVRDDGLDDRIFIATSKDMSKVESALEKWNEDWQDCDMVCWHPCEPTLIAKNITDKQLEKFNLDTAWSILDEIFLCDMMKWYFPNDVACRLRRIANKKYVDKWNKEGNKKWWNDFKNELEEAKYNPRHPLGKLEFDRRAEADGIVWKDEEEEEDEEHRKHLIECIMKSPDAGTGDDFTDKEKFPIDLLEEIQRQVFKEYAEDNLLPWGQERDIAIKAFYKEHFN
jgi:hypothetical protein